MHSALSRLPKWKLDREEDDIRGWALHDVEGRSLGTVGDLIVDTDTQYVTTIVTVDGKEYPAHDVRVGDRVLMLETPQSQVPAATTKSMEEPTPITKARDAVATGKDAVTTTKQKVIAKKESIAGNGPVRAAPGGADEDLVVPLVDEELDVGTRRIETGGKRVASHIVSEPVSRDVVLREERVGVERHAVDRALEAAEAEACFRDAKIEMRAKAEQAVVAKSAHVVEEVILRRDRSERQQRVRDTVRHTDVEITKLNGGASMKGAHG
jgi:uncharacterized protein (TIGR02271 family)